MKMRALSFLVLVSLLVLACSRNSLPELVITFPQGFTGDVYIELGISDAPPLNRVGNRYIVPIPPDGKLRTSTTLAELRPQFPNNDPDHIWGYESLVQRTGDGIVIGGKIEFFVGTKDQYESQNAKRHKSHIVSGPILG
jgi:hypothetical protein